MALQYHPDKNGNSIESTEKFKLINESYEFLKNQIILGVGQNNDDDNDDIEKENKSFVWSTNNYSILLQSFLESFFKEHGLNINMTVIKDIILNGCKKIPLDKEQSMNIYSFLSKHKNILHISQETLDTIKEIVLDKFKDDQMYILNPSLDDLLENNVYKLLVDSSIYYVPLWHSEVYFDKVNILESETEPNIDANIEPNTETNTEKTKSKTNGEIIVRCIPDLPNNITIDENNILHIELNNIPFNVSFFDKHVVLITIGKNQIEVPIKFKRIKTCFLPNYGVSIINENNIYDIETRAGIYIKITFI